VIAGIEQRIAEWSRIPAENGEPIQVGWLLGLAGWLVWLVWLARRLAGCLAAWLPGWLAASAGWLVWRLWLLPGLAHDGRRPRPSGQPRPAGLRPMARCPRLPAAAAPCAGSSLSAHLRLTARPAPPLPRPAPPPGAQVHGRPEVRRALGLVRRPGAPQRLPARGQPAGHRADVPVGWVRQQPAEEAAAQHHLPTSSTPAAPSRLRLAYPPTPACPPAAQMWRPAARLRCRWPSPSTRCARSWWTPASAPPRARWRCTPTRATRCSSSTCTWTARRGTAPRCTPAAPRSRCAPAPAPPLVHV
jgi:hypothetical protein